MTKKWSSEEPPCFKISTHTLYRYAINMLYSIRNSLPQTTHTLIVRHLDPLNHVNFFCYISTRAPKRCDTLNTMVTLLYLHFNPRSHTRCNEAYGNFMWITQISTRTPTQGATAMFLTALWSIQKEVLYAKLNFVKLHKDQHCWNDSSTISISIHAKPSDILHNWGFAWNIY